MTTPAFVHLHAHTAFSLSSGAIKVKDLAKHAAKIGYPALAVADTGTLAGAYEFSKAMAEAGVQPILGSEVKIRFAEGVEGAMVLLAKDAEGWANLMNIVSRSALQETAGPTPAQLLKRYSSGLIALTGGWDGPLDRLLKAGRVDEARGLMKALAGVFGDRLYVELQRYGRPDEERVIPALLELADDAGAGAVASVDAYYLTPDAREAHEVLRCIASGEYIDDVKRVQLPEGHHLRTPAEMGRLFADLPDALEATVEVAQRCAFRLSKAKSFMLPEFPGLEGRTEAEALAQTARDGLEERLATVAPSAPREEYDRRLAYEIDLIQKMGFSGYFLIVSDFIRWAKDQGIPVGPGRGSGAGSLVAWSMKITDLDPLRFGLLFERFLNPDRVSMPDFDIDFCQERREEVIDYVKARYGRDRVAQIGTIGKLQARAAVRDVGRVLGLPYPKVDRYVRLIPQNPTNPVTLEQALQLPDVAAEVGRAEPTVRRMFDIAVRLEGLFRHTSTHAAGVVIASRPLLDVVPLYRDDHGHVVTQYDMKSVEEIGLVKFDFLGLKTLDVIQQTIDLAGRKGQTVDFTRIGDADRETYEMVAEGHTFGVFQFESAGMRDAIRRVRPSRLEDLIALGALYRPGPMENIPTYAAVKHKEQDAEYLHPLLEKVLADTYGVIVYQEDVMLIAQLLSGYTLGQADLLRRAMGKKIKAEMDAQRSIFVEGAKAGWVEIELDDGRRVKRHAKLPVRTVDGRWMPLSEAMAAGIEVEL